MSGYLRGKAQDYIGVCKELKKGCVGTRVNVRLACVYQKCCGVMQSA